MSVAVSWNAFVGPSPSHFPSVNSNERVSNPGEETSTVCGSLVGRLGKFEIPGLSETSRHSPLESCAYCSLPSSSIVA